MTTEDHFIDTESPRPSVPDVGRTALLLGAIFVLDMLVAGQGFLAIVTALIGVPLTLAALWSFARSDAELGRSRLLRSGLFFLLFPAVYLTGGFHARHAEHQAERIIRAVDQFEVETGAFPNDLDELVPEHLSGIPRSRYTLLYSDFMYVAGDSTHILSYVVLPPFGRRMYVFETRTWRFLD